jgi:hypothetical protein
MAKSSCRISVVLAFMLLLTGLYSCSSKKSAAKSAASAFSQGTFVCDSVSSVTVRGARIRYRDVSGKDLSFNARFYVQKDNGIYVTASVLGFEVARGYADKEEFNVLNRMNRVCYSGDKQTYMKYLGMPFSPGLFFLLFTGNECIARELSPFSIVRSSSSEILLEDPLRGTRIILDKSASSAGKVDKITIFGKQGMIKAEVLEREASPVALPASMYVELSDDKGNMKRRADFTLSESSVNEVRAVRFKVPSQYEVKKL